MVTVNPSYECLQTDGIIVRDVAAQLISPYSPRNHCRFSEEGDLTIMKQASENHVFVPSLSRAAMAHDGS